MRRRAAPARLHRLMGAGALRRPRTSTRCARKRSTRSARYAEAALEPERRSSPGASRVPVAAKVLDAADLVAATDAVLDAYLTEGRFADAFRAGLARAAEREHAVLVGSGSQANLLAVAAALLASARAPARARRRGDHRRDRLPDDGRARSTSTGLVPVYVDVEPDTYNPSLEAIAAAIGPRTRGDRARPHARQPVRRARRRGALPRARPRPDRGLLRRARLAHRRPPRRARSAPRRPTRSIPPTT